MCLQNSIEEKGVFISTLTPAYIERKLLSEHNANQNTSLCPPSVSGLETANGDNESAALTNDSGSQYGGVGSVEAHSTAEDGGRGRRRAAPSQDTQRSLQQARARLYCLEWEMGSR